MAQDVKRNDDGLNIAGLIGLPEHNKVQTVHKQLKRDTNGRWRSENYNSQSKVEYQQAIV